MPMKSIFTSFILVIVGISLISIVSCKKEESHPKISNIVFNPNITYGTLKDIDGNSYKTVVIGTQTWMAENLRTTKFRDTTDIPNVMSGSAWDGLSTPGYCNYNNTLDADTIEIYGRLYNFSTVNSGKICPTGWHVPSDSEWTIVSDCIVSNGEVLKETGTTHWASPNNLASNETGFTAIPAGSRTGQYFGHKNLNANWWSSTYNFGNKSYTRSLSYNDTTLINELESTENGLSIRCVKD